MQTFVSFVRVPEFNPGTYITTYLVQQYRIDYYRCYDITMTQI